MQETRVWFLGPEDPLFEKGWATHSSILCFPGGSAGKEEIWVGKMPWKRERLLTAVFWPGEFHGPYSPSDRRVGHDWATFSHSVNTRIPFHSTCQCPLAKDYQRTHLYIRKLCALTCCSERACTPWRAKSELVTGYQKGVTIRLGLLLGDFGEGSRK